MKVVTKQLAKKQNAFLVLMTWVMLFLPQITSGAEKYKAGDKLYVAPTTGLRVRALSSQTASVLATLGFNEVVMVLADSLAAKPFQVAVNNFNLGTLPLQGHWVKVKAGKASGYVFDGMLSQYKGQRLGGYEAETYYTSVFGSPSLKTVQKSKIIEGQKLPYETEIKTYPRGLVMESSFFDGCFNEVYSFNVSFNEAYWLIERIMLHDDAAQEVKITKEKDKTVLRFYSCT